MSRIERPPRICSAPGCPIPADECRDPAHRGTGWRPDSVRGSRHERGYGAEWDRTRARILKRDPWCKICALERSTEVDHEKPKTSGGTDEETNLRGVCAACHRAKTSREAARARRNEEGDET